MERLWQPGLSAAVGSLVLAIAAALPLRTLHVHAQAGPQWVPPAPTQPGTYPPPAQYPGYANPGVAPGPPVGQPPVGQPTAVAPPGAPVVAPQRLPAPAVPAAPAATQLAPTPPAGAKADVSTNPAAPDASTPASQAKPDLPRERVEADVSTRSVAITSSFTGTEIVIFGSVDNSRQETAESGLYDVAIIVEGIATPVVARKKSRVAGLWINTQSALFNAVPSYYTIISTRPIEEIADTNILHANEIGFNHVPMKLSPDGPQMSPDELAEFKKAVVRRKQADNLFQKKGYGVVFIGRSLFRSTISLPANVPVGPLTAQVFLFKDGKLLSSHKSRVMLQREGIERLLHSFAFDYPLYYGIFSVMIAVAAGMIASALFKRGSH